MNLSYKQRSQINQIVMKEISKVTDEMLRNKEKYYTNGFLTGIKINQVTSLILERLYLEVDNSNSIISNLRGQARKFRSFKINEVFEKQFKHDEHNFNEFLAGFETAYDELMSQSKKKLQGHNTKRHYQNKICIRTSCRNKINGELATLTNRGFVCQECLPIEKQEE